MSEPVGRSVPPKSAAEACPICGRRPDGALRPFCSKRCADVDLGRWFTESYRVPAGHGPEFDEGEGPRETDADETG